MKVKNNIVVSQFPPKDTNESNNTKLLKSINDLKVEQTKLLSRITALEEANNTNPKPETK